MELRIEQLALNTIAQSEYLPEFDEASSTLNAKGEHRRAQFGQEFDTDLDEFVTCRNAFAQLKKLMNKIDEDEEEDGEGGPGSENPR